MPLLNISKTLNLSKLKVKRPFGSPLQAFPGVCWKHFARVSVSRKSLLRRFTVASEGKKILLARCPIRSSLSGQFEFPASI